MPKIPIPASPAPSTVGKTASSVNSTRKSRPRRRKALTSSSKASAPVKRTVPRQDPIFASALNALIERYTKAINKRAELGYQLAMLNAEIPALEDSMKALNNQLHPQPLVTGEIFQLSNEQAASLSQPSAYYQPPAQRAIAEALPLPPRTVPSDLAAQAMKAYGPGVNGGSLRGMGSIPASIALKGRKAPGPVAVSDPLEEPLEGAEIAGDIDVQEVS